MFPELINAKVFVASLQVNPSVLSSSTTQKYAMKELFTVIPK